MGRKGMHLESYSAIYRRSINLQSQTSLPSTTLFCTFNKHQLF